MGFTPTIFYDLAHPHCQAPVAGPGNPTVSNQAPSATGTVSNLTQTDLVGNYTLVNMGLLGSKISQTAKLISFVMCSLKRDKHGYNKITQRRLSKIFGITETGVIKNIEILKEKGWISDVVREDGYHRPNEYKLVRVTDEFDNDTEEEVETDEDGEAEF